MTHFEIQYYLVDDYSVHDSNQILTIDILDYFYLTHEKHEKASFFYDELLQKLSESEGLEIISLDKLVQDAINGMFNFFIMK